MNYCIHITNTAITTKGGKRFVFRTTVFCICFIWAFVNLRNSFTFNLTTETCISSKTILFISFMTTKVGIVKCFAIYFFMFFKSSTVEIISWQASRFILRASHVRGSILSKIVHTRWLKKGFTQFL